MEQLEIFLCWQAGLLAVLASLMTEFVKRLINILTAEKEDGDGRLSLRERLSNELRKDSILINQLLLPALPCVFGAALAYVLPHPEVMIEYMKTHTLPAWKLDATYAVWGFICGALSSLLFDRIRGLLLAVVERKTAAGNEEG